MNAQQIPVNGQTRVRFIRVVKAFSASEVGGKAIRLFALLIALLLGVSGLNVVNSYVGRDFMTAIENRNSAEFIWQAILYFGVFAACTGVAVVFRFTEERLGLIWREWLTRRLVTLYLGDRTYYRLKATGEMDNPDERIADDVRAFTVTTLSFILMILNGTITVVAFSGVMWSISPMLFAVTVVYAVSGSFIAVGLGRPLVGLNYSQLEKEANFRSDLIHVRENAESVALARREGRVRARLLHRLGELAANFEKIIAVNRNLGFFTTGYNYLIQIIPALVVAPLFMRGEVQFGVITQSAMAFAQLVGAFSLIVTQFQSISSFAAVVSRLGSLGEAIEQAKSSEVSGIEVVREQGRIAYESLTLWSPKDGRPLVKELSASVPCGTRLLVLGSDETAKLALLRATAGLWNNGEGRIIRPGLDHILFLPERPYLPPGTLREVLVRTGQEHAISDVRILDTLRALNLEPVLMRSGGLYAEQDWDDILSLGEQQLLAFTHMLLAAPRFAFLDRASTALSPEQVEHILTMLCEHAITYINIGEVDDRLDYYDAVLELTGDGGWKWTSIP